MRLMPHSHPRRDCCFSHADVEVSRLLEAHAGERKMRRLERVMGSRGRIYREFEKDG
jgi:hypothetical protein